MKSIVLNSKPLNGTHTLQTTAAFNNDELCIYDMILSQKWNPDDPYVTPDEVINFLADAPSELTVRINSSGGEVGAAMAMYNRLLEHKGTVNTIVDGYAFSSAGWLALAGSNRQICNGGLFMMHNPYMFEEINSMASIKAAENRWSAHRDAIVNIFTSRTSMKADEVQNLMEDTTYFGAQEAVDKGLFHSIRNATPQTAMLNSLKVPQAALNKATMPAGPSVEELRRRALNARKISIT
jgi:ATP-dependent protease ClpP protease subunit